MMNSLEASGYHVLWRLLDSLEYAAVPQRRLRVYIVGFRKDKMSGAPQWPDPVPHRPLSKVLENNLPRSDVGSLSKTYLRNLCEATAELSSLTFVPDKSVADITTGKTDGIAIRYGYLPTITKSRATPGFWFLRWERFAVLEEIAQCQGFRKGEITIPPGISDHQVKQMIGNAFAVGMLERLFEEFSPRIGF